ncbi:MAG TPA: glycogen debranching enzyme N-terminal domain-containing protein, partial [archaeon]|nr:glycogen debranching enzyme N-terminal domain-containing protein [archaeon]
MITFGPNVTREYARSSRLEWLVANGLGGYSSSTVAGSNTRRYHG